MFETFDIQIFLIMGLATFRIVELLVKDDGPFFIFSGWRRFLGRRANNNKVWNMLAEVFHCPYCMGIWVAILVFFMPLALQVIFGIAAIQSILTQLLDKYQQE